MKQLRAYKIDVGTQTIERIQITPAASLYMMQEIVGDYIEGIRLDAKNMLYVDENAKLKADCNTRGRFCFQKRPLINGFPTFDFIGNGVICGIDEHGCIADSTLSPALLEKVIIFAKGE